MILRRVFGLVCSLVFGLFFLGGSPAQSFAAGQKVFRYSLSIDPSVPDPLKISSSESNYFFVNVYRGLYFVDQNGQARPEVAESCDWVNSDFKRLKCRIKNRAKWSDGSDIVAKHFVDSWARLKQPDSKGLGSQLVANIESAAALSDRVLEIRLKVSDSEFTQRLSHPALVATKSEKSYQREDFKDAPVSGPYRVVDWKPGGRIRLEANPHYLLRDDTQVQGQTGGPPPLARRPVVEILTVDDDETAFNLYREGTLSFLRRLPSHYLKTWRGSKELFQIPVLRFDYVGFGVNLRNEAEFRKALALSLNYSELKSLYDSLGTPGCPSIAPEWMTKIPCHQFDLEKAKKHLLKAPAALREKTWTLYFSKLGGDDVKTGMEWMQNQWKKNLGLKVELQAVEQAVYLAKLRHDPPDLFRKGVGLDRATCLAAVEIFSKGDPENFIRLNSEKYEKAISDLKQARTESQKKTACTKVVNVLVDEAYVIPLGRIHFSVLAKPDFKGWSLNPLNQLDLSGLRASDLD